MYEVLVDCDIDEFDLGTYSSLSGFSQAFVETLLLSGLSSTDSFADLAHAWGCNEGFHVELSAGVCERRGKVLPPTKSEQKKENSGGEKNGTADRKDESWGQYEQAGIQEVTFSQEPAGKDIDTADASAKV